MIAVDGAIIVLHIVKADNAQMEVRWSTSLSVLCCLSALERNSQRLSVIHTPSLHQSSMAYDSGK